MQDKNEAASDLIVLVDENDNDIRMAEKLAAHLEAKMHRAFSIFIFNSRGELMLQKRAKQKYHSGGLWTNTCCSHPRPNEPLEQAARRRLQEEMGFSCPLTEKFSFKYKVEFDNGLTENEYDHVFTGNYNQEPKINPAEAEDWKWMNLTDLKQDIKNNPDIYSHWIKIAIDKF
jgi:isopentenyl-diphosphate delta-isomerase